MIIGQKVKFGKSGTFECGEEGWKRIEWPENSMFVPSLENAYRVLFEAYISIDRGQHYFSDWLSLLVRDGIQLPSFFEYDAEYEILTIIRSGWMVDYLHLREDFDKGKNLYETLRKAMIVAEQTRVLALQLGSEPIQHPLVSLHATLAEAEAQFELLAKAIIVSAAPESKLKKSILPKMGPVGG